MIKQCTLLSLSLLILFSNQVFSAGQNDLSELPLEELMNIKVTSASKKAQLLSDAPAAIFVINQEDIKRSGATSIPDVLRLAPGLEVGRIDANKWAVSARGFNGRFANKLLVLIDGRSIYTQAFSGVYWENQDVMLEDIERIEVIRGPGAALWGANAVNGVINIMTKHASDTKGGLITAGGGSKELGFGSLRYGAQLGKDTSARIYAKGYQRDDFKHLSGEKANDSWNKIQGGFRIDSTLTPQDALTVSGDAYYSDINQNLTLASLTSPILQQSYDKTAHTSGGNIRSNFEHTFSATSSYKLQVNYDIYDRNELFDHEIRNTVDVDFQHHFGLNSWNDIVWGMSYRYMDGQNFLPIPNIFRTSPPERRDHYFSTFVQDEVALIDHKLWLTVGSKFEHNNYTGFEIQPTARLLWIPHEQHRFWGAISRAVRTPSVVDDDLRLTTQFIPPNHQPNPFSLPLATVVSGTHAFKAEELLAYELGYRTTFAKSVSIDMTAFYNDYHSLRSLSPSSPILNPSSNFLDLPLVANNSNKGETFGFETSVIWQMLDSWRWDLTYSYLNTHIPSTVYYQDTISPQHKTSIRAEINPWENINLDFWLRYADESSFFTLQGPFHVNSYVTMDVRLAWKPHNDIELSVTGQNLLDKGHVEAISEVFIKPTEVPRSVFGKIAWHF